MALKREGTLSQLVLESIQNSIRDGEFRPGEALPSERELAERYGVGKSSIREAVKMLQVLGVVETAQGRGTYLRMSAGPQIMRPLLLDMMLRRANPEELYEFRLMFESASLRLAAAKASDEHKRRAREAYERLCEAQRDGSHEAAERDREFHSAILEATANSFVVNIGKMIHELCLPYMNESSKVHDEAVLESHGKILEIFCEGGGESLDEAVEGAIAVFRKALGAAMRVEK